MEVPYLSASRLKLAQDCTFAYAEKYGSGSKDAFTAKMVGEHRHNMQAARNGTNIHNALEEWRRPNPKTGRVRRPIFSKLMELYDKECAQNEVDFNVYEDGKEMLTRWFSKRGVTTVKILDVEQSLGSHNAPFILPLGTPIFGFIDLVVEHDDGAIELIDYKSQRKPIKQEEADSDIQAGIYLAVASEIWPNRPLRFTFDLLRYGTMTTVWSDSKIESFKTWLHGQYTWLTSLTDPQPTIGNGCKWCPYIELCPTAQDLIQNGSWDLVVGDDPTELDRDEMLTTLAAVKAAKSILDKKQREMTQTIKDEWFDSVAGGDTLTTDNWKVSFDDKTRTEFIPSEVQRLVPPSVFGQMVGLTKTAVERVLPILPEDVAEDIRRSAIVKPFRTLNIRRNSDGDPR